MINNAKDYSYEVESYLKGLGFNIIKEYLVPDRGDGRSGRIDLLAYNGNKKIFIELDQSSPRKKSIYKLRQVDGKKVIFLRNYNSKVRRPEGIDLLVFWNN